MVWIAMSRSIKFRVWDKETKEMQPVAAIDWRNGAILDISTGGVGYGVSYHNLPGRYELMQFTGLLDMNGSEIYEGDILRPPQSDKPIPPAYNDPVVIEWLQAAAMYVLLRLGTDNITHSIHRTAECKVIGNIHENLELLKT